MTIICALKAPTGVWVASDSQATLWGSHRTLGVAKWSLAGGRAAAACGTVSAIHLMHGADLVANAGTAREFAKDLSRAIQECGAKVSRDDGYPDHKASFIWTDGRSIWDAGSEMVAGEVRETFIADGSGSSYAFGAYEALSSYDVEPAQMLRRIVEICCRFDNKCGGEPFVAFVPAA